MPGAQRQQRGAGENMKNRIVIKSSRAGMTVILDPEWSFEDLIAELAAKFKDSARFWGTAQMALLLQGRPLTAAQEMQLVNTITENSGIEVLCLLDQDLERVERCEKALNQKLMELSERTGQFYRGTLKRGDTLESEASIVIIGDVNPGANVTSKGNIVVLGSLRGIAYAGATGDRNCFVAALVMKPIQVKIADKMARSAITKRVDDAEYKLDPKIAYVKEDHIYVKPISQEILGELSV